jgi:ATP-binding cassette subfamily B protein
MKKLTLPVFCSDFLKDHGIDKTEILHFVIADMKENGLYGDTYVLLTKTKLVLVVAPSNKNQTRHFAGYQKEIQTYDKELLQVHFYNINTITELKIQRYVTSGCLYCNLNEQDTYLVSFSNSFIGQFSTFISIFNKVKEGNEIKEEDINMKDEHESCPKCGLLYPDKERKICPKCMDKRSIFFRTFSYFLPHKFKLIIMVLCYIGTSLLNLAWPYLNGTILYDKVLSKDEAFLEVLNLPIHKFTYALLAIVVTMLLTKLTSQILGIIQGYMAATIVPDVVCSIKTKIFESMGKLSISFFNNKQTGSLMTRVLHDANQVTGFFIDGLPYLFINILTILFTCIVMFTMNAKLALASLFLLPFLTLISYKLLPRLWSYYGKRHRANRTLNGQINDNITGARVVKAFGREKSEINRFSNYNGKVRKAELDLVTFDNRFYALYSMVENIASFIVWGLGSYLLLQKTGLEFGVLITFVGYVSQLNGPLNFFSYIFRWWADSINSAGRIFEIIDAIPEITEVKDPIPMENLEGNITLDSVTFGYEAHNPILKEISFEVKNGEMLGIVGRSGAGKSTLVNLISRLYDPQVGEILIDGIPIKKMAFSDLRKNIAMVSQETYIFIGTIAQNIAYAKPDASIKDIIHASILSSAHDFITKMPDGYDTIIGSSGRSLSGGERQRISIARAILADPKILILDEATASVDTETEQSIQNSLNMLVKGRTTLSIAHRLSTLKNADKLVVIDEGKLTEAGTHEELIEQKGTYYKLMELQTKALALRGIE